MRLKLMCMLMLVAIVIPVCGQLSAIEYNSMLRNVKDPLDPPSAEELFMQGGTKTPDQCDLVAGCYANEEWTEYASPPSGGTAAIGLIPVIIEGAIELDERYRLFDKFNARGWYKKAEDHYNNGRYELALLCANKSIEIHYNYSDSWTLKGTSLYMLGRYTESIDCCNMAISLNPDDARAWHTKGIALYRLGRYKEAVCSCNNALGIDASDSKASEYRRLACGALGCYY